VITVGQRSADQVPDQHYLNFNVAVGPFWNERPDACLEALDVLMKAPSHNHFPRAWFLRQGPIYPPDRGTEAQHRRTAIRHSPLMPYHINPSVDLIRHFSHAGPV
jgi:hypothetical protein